MVRTSGPGTNIWLGAEAETAEVRPRRRWVSWFRRRRRTRLHTGFRRLEKLHLGPPTRARPRVQVTRMMGEFRAKKVLSFLQLVNAN
jgi:hypothetical protein